jgi:arabinofuranosyltransferase
MTRPARERATLVLAAGAGVAFSLALVAIASHRNGFDGFPLDDPWIHLTFARTLSEHGSFAYFPGDAATAGSTSPLYTLLLAAGFLFTSHEKWLAYALGIGAQAGFLLAVGAWAKARLDSAAAAAAVVLLLGWDGRIALLSASGMETSLFLLTIAAAFSAWTRGRTTACACAVGASVWTRPEGLILAGVFAIDGALARALDREDANQPAPWRPVAILSGIVAAYALFNLGTGGHLLPNTFAAKTAYYGGLSRSAFLKRDVLGLFASGGWVVVGALAVVGLGREIREVVLRRRGPFRPEAGWLVALPLAYAIALPYPHRFARYLVPLLPAAAILAAGIGRDAFRALARGSRTVRTAVAAAVALAVTIPHALAARAAISEYASFCRYHAVRHEACGRWLLANTPADAVIATHDIGAIAFYSRRRIVDLAGLIDPEVVPHLHDPDPAPYLTDLFARRHVTHLAVLRNWLEVSNVEPLFVADPEPAILEVYPWRPGRTHLVPVESTRWENRAAERLAAGDAAGAGDLVDRALAIDPSCARTHLLRGKVHAALRRLPEAESEYRQAIALEPESPEARYALATVLAATGRRDEALAIASALRGEGSTLPRLEAFYRALGGV